MKPAEFFALNDENKGKAIVAYLVTVEDPLTRVMLTWALAMFLNQKGKTR